SRDSPGRVLSESCAVAPLALRRRQSTNPRPLRLRPFQTNAAPHISACGRLPKPDLQPRARSADTSAHPPPAQPRLHSGARAPSPAVGAQSSPARLAGDAPVSSALRSVFLPKPPSLLPSAAPSCSASAVAPRESSAGLHRVPLFAASLYQRATHPQA